MTKIELAEIADKQIDREMAYIISAKILLL